MPKLWWSKKKTVQGAWFLAKGAPGPRTEVKLSSKQSRSLNDQRDQFFLFSDASDFDFLLILVSTTRRHTQDNAFHWPVQIALDA